MSLLIIAYCLLLRSLDALHHEKGGRSFLDRMRRLPSSGTEAVTTDSSKDEKKNFK